jgi:hypothetical protein
MKSILIFLFLSSTIFISCDKDDDGGTNNTPTVCDVKALYAGTATSSTGTNATMVYQLKDNNFAVSYVSVGGAAVTFGGYRNTCDSVIISSYYTGNSNYYLLKGILNASKTVISGTFQNQTNTLDFGTFSITKQ